jgi:hypothetical protein
MKVAARTVYSQAARSNGLEMWPTRNKRNLTA